MERWALIFPITTKKLFQFNGVNPHTIAFGTEADISNICQYGWYAWVIFVISKHLSLTRRNALDDASALLRMKWMQWLN